MLGTSLLNLFFILFILWPANCVGDEYKQVAGLIDLRTTWSDGEYDLDSLVRLARSRGFRVIFINDHDRMALEYGLFPLRHIIKFRLERRSVNEQGAEKYLAAIRETGHKYPDTLLIPGVESAPLYYWTGNPLSGLTAHGWERHILAIGMERHEDYTSLPAIHNSAPAITRQRILFVILPGLAIAGGFLAALRLKGKKTRMISALILVPGILVVADYLLSPCTAYDQYHGDRSQVACQAFIDYVNTRGGFTFWNHPETKSGVGEKPPIHVNTPPYPEVLENSSGYTGFAALYGDSITVTEPGHEWDSVLQNYCKGTRRQPIWGISTADYHQESSDKLGDFPTVFMVKSFTKEAVLNALRTGKMYAVSGPYDKRGTLNFTVTDPLTGNQGVCGDEIVAKGSVVIRIEVETIDSAERKVEIRLIRGGQPLKIFNSVTPFIVNLKDDYFVEGLKTYYRMDARGEIGSIVSNPIFVSFTGR